MNKELVKYNFNQIYYTDLFTTGRPSRIKVRQFIHPFQETVAWDKDQGCNYVIDVKVN